MLIGQITFFNIGQYGGNAVFVVALKNPNFTQTPLDHFSQSTISSHFQSCSGLIFFKTQQRIYFWSTYTCMLYDNIPI